MPASTDRVTLRVCVDNGFRSREDLLGGCKRFEGEVCVPAAWIGTTGWQFIWRRGRYGSELYTRCDLGNPSAIHAKPCRYVVLSIASCEHTFHYSGVAQ